MRKGRREGGLPRKGDDGEINKDQKKSTFSAINLYVFWLGGRRSGWQTGDGAKKTRDEMAGAPFPPFSTNVRRKTNEDEGQR